MCRYHLRIGSIKCEYIFIFHLLQQGLLVQWLVRRGPPKVVHFNTHSYSIFYVSILSLRLGLAATASHAASKSQYRVAWNGLITNGSLSR